jgi:hypothetical protein
VHTINKKSFCADWNAILTEGPSSIGQAGRFRNWRLAQLLWPDEDHEWI